MIRVVVYCIPYHVKEASTEINARDICRDVVDKLPIGERGPGTGSKLKRPRVYGCDKPSADKNASGSSTIEEVVYAEGRAYLHHEQTYDEPNASSNRRYTICVEMLPGI